MTCIIGYLDKKNKCTWIGCDSLGSNGYTKAVESQPKIFRNKVFENVILVLPQHLDILIYLNIQKNCLMKLINIKM